MAVAAGVGEAGRRDRGRGRRRQDGRQERRRLAQQIGTDRERAQDGGDQQRSGEGEDEARGLARWSGDLGVHGVIDASRGCHRQRPAQGKRIGAHRSRPSVAGRTRGKVPLELGLLGARELEIDRGGGQVEDAAMHRSRLGCRRRSCAALPGFEGATELGARAAHERPCRALGPPDRGGDLPAVEPLGREQQRRTGIGRESGQRTMQFGLALGPERIRSPAGLVHGGR